MRIWAVMQLVRENLRLLLVLQYTCELDNGAVSVRDWERKGDVMYWLEMGTGVVRADLMDEWSL